MPSPPSMIGVCGGIGQGKDTVAKHLHQSHGYLPLTFARDMKGIVAHIYGIDESYLRGTQAEKNATIPELRGPNGERWTGRRLMEFIADNLRQVDPDVWLRKAQDEKRAIEEAYGFDPSGISWVFTDVRYPNEFDAIKREGGVVWRVSRIGGPPIERTGHDSDSHWEHFPVDANLVARWGDLDGLCRQVDVLVRAGGREAEGLLDGRLPKPR